MSREELEATPPLEQHLATVVADIIKDKDERNVSPITAEMSEILARMNKDIKESLNAMVRSGLLTFHRTLNSVTFEFTPPK